MHDLWCRDNLLKSSLGYVLLSFSYFPFSATDGPKCFFVLKQWYMICSINAQTFVKFHCFSLVPLHVQLTAFLIWGLYLIATAWLIVTPLVMRANFSALFCFSCCLEMLPLMFSYTSLFFIPSHFIIFASSATLIHLNDWFDELNLSTSYCFKPRRNNLPQHHII